MHKLRNKCGNINGDFLLLKRTNDLRCTCGYFFEDVGHFFFICPQYSDRRTALHNFVSLPAPFNLRTLLYGDDNTNINISNNIYLETVKYVANTKRFTHTF